MDFFLIQNFKKINLNQYLAVKMTYRRSDRLGRARLLKAQLKAKLPRMVSGDWDSRGRRSSTFFNRRLRRQIEPIFIKLFCKKLYKKKNKTKKTQPKH